MSSQKEKEGTKDKEVIDVDEEEENNDDENDDEQEEEEPRICNICKNAPAVIFCVYPEMSGFCVFSEDKEPKSRKEEEDSDEADGWSSGEKSSENDDESSQDHEAAGACLECAKKGKGYCDECEIWHCDRCEEYDEERHSEADTTRYISRCNDCKKRLCKWFQDACGRECGNYDEGCKTRLCDDCDEKRGKLYGKSSFFQELGDEDEECDGGGSDDDYDGGVEECYDSNIFRNVRCLKCVAKKKQAQQQPQQNQLPERRYRW